MVREERRRRKKRRGRLMRKHEEERGRKRGEKRGSVDRGVVVNTKRSRLDSLLAWPGSGSCQGGAESGSYTDCGQLYEDPRKQSESRWDTNHEIYFHEESMMIGEGNKEEVSD